MKPNPLVDTRRSTFPIMYPTLWALYKKASALTWFVEEVDLAGDVAQWKSLGENERYFIKVVLAFFAGSDNLVNENLCMRFFGDVQATEARSFYAAQVMIEAVHAEMYSVLIDTYISDPAEKDRLFHAIDTMPAVGEKARFAMEWMGDESPFAARLLAFACVEGIHFSGSFCAIFWIKSQGKMPGLCFSNELISRDEGLHVDFAVELYSLLTEGVDVETAHAIFRDAVDIELAFITEALPVSLLGMNCELMSEYVKYVADRLLLRLGFPALYAVPKCPFDFMELISVPNKTNFFEAKLAEYARSGVGFGSKTVGDVDLDADF
mgnify:CR=1 FL=1